MGAWTPVLYHRRRFESCPALRLFWKTGKSKRATQAARPSHGSSAALSKVKAGGCLNTEVRRRLWLIADRLFRLTPRPVWSMMKFVIEGRRPQSACASQSGGGGTDGKLPSSSRRVAFSVLDPPFSTSIFVRPLLVSDQFTAQRPLLVLPLRLFCFRGEADETNVSAARAVSDDSRPIPRLQFVRGSAAESGLYLGRDTGFGHVINGSGNRGAARDHEPQRSARRPPEGRAWPTRRGTGTYRYSQIGFQRLQKRQAGLYSLGPGVHNGNLGSSGLEYTVIQWEPNMEIPV